MSKQSEAERLEVAISKLEARAKTETQKKRLKILTDRLEKITPKKKFFSKSTID